MKWPKMTIETRDGLQKAIAPQIISASRSTDIPAFYAEWFFKRLEEGYCKWINPFNRRPQYISFANARAVVFWTKNATPLLPYLPVLERRGLCYYFQFTLNDYEAEGLEPNVPSLEDRIAMFRCLSEMIGKERVIWRFDPLILAGSLSIGQLLEKVERVGREIAAHTEKLVFSFADIMDYAKVSRNLTRHGVTYREFGSEDMCRFASGVARVASKWDLEVCSCAEAIDLEDYGILHNRCIDDKLLMRLSGDSVELAEVLYPRGAVDGVLFEDTLGRPTPLKDKGQREACGCVVSKDIGQYDTCPHQCLYCYANTSPRAVERNRTRTSTTGDVILSPRQLSSGTSSACDGSLPPLPREVD